MTYKEAATVRILDDEMEEIQVYLQLQKGPGIDWSGTMEAVLPATVWPTLGKNVEITLSDGKKGKALVNNMVAGSGKEVGHFIANGPFPE